MLYAKNVPESFQAEVLRTAAYLINILSQNKLEFISPYEKLQNTKPIIGYFRVFGCFCYVFVPNQLYNKFDKKVFKCILTGYDNKKKKMEML